MEVLASFGTGLQHTRVRRAADGRITWERRRGPDHPGRYPSVPAEFAARSAAASSDVVRFAAPALSSAEHAEWPVFSTGSAAQALLDVTGPAPALAAVAGCLGRQLAVLHRDSVHIPDDDAVPVGPARLSAWMRHGRGPRVAQIWHRRLRAGLGEHRWRKLQDWTMSLVEASGERNRVGLHGWMSWGSLIISDSARTEAPGTVLLSGLEIARGRPEIDLGWAVGELVEFGAVACRRGLSTAPLSAVRDAFLGGYGPGWDRDVVGIAATIRLAVHGHDFAAYVGWHSDLDCYTTMLVDLLDTDARFVCESEVTEVL